MSNQAPPTLLDLAQQKLLREEALSVSALEYLPKELFPPVFVEAFTKRKTDVLKTMVQAWPFPCLPLGALLKIKDLDILKAVLDGLDLLIREKVRPRKWKLEVLDLQDVHHNFWNTWAGVKESVSARVVNENQVVKDLPRHASKSRLRVLSDLCLNFQLDEYETKLLHWAQLRRSSIQLCCPKLHIWALPFHVVQKVLSVFHPQYIEELDLNTGWNLFTLLHFALYYLSEMRNLCTLRFAQIYKNDFSIDTEKKCVMTFVSQFSKLHCLQHLRMTGANFLSDHMEHLFRSLKSPLETLSITFCQFSQSDLNSLSTCQSLSQLKHLNLSGIKLFDLCPLPLQVLLERVSDSLQALQLEHCRMQDSQIRALLPALSQCSQLTKVNFYDNDFSVAVLQDLLHHTASLIRLTLELYPAPLECFDDMGEFLPERFALICPQLMDALSAVRQPKSVSFATNMCLECCSRSVYDQETRLCSCWQ